MLVRAGSLGSLLAFAALGCSDSSGHSLFQVDPALDAGEGGDDAGAPGDGGGSDGSDDSGADGSCPSGPNDDLDGDGFTPAQGDCNDCDPRINPGAYDYPGNGIDEDCSGVADDEPAACDSGLAISADDPEDGARALGICRKAALGSWGLISAKWVLADGTTTSGGGTFTCSLTEASSTLPHPKQRGILPKFGAQTSPREGGSLLALSSGVARDTAGGANGRDASAFQACTSSAAPAGFPRKSPMCSTQAEPSDKRAFDPVALELTIRVPTNAQSLSFDFNLFTADFPTYVCEEFNDFFAALLTSSASGLPADRNIAIDAQKGHMGPNTPLLRACSAQKAKEIDFPCPLGTASLQGTGYEGNAATGWLRTTAPVASGETITLRFAVWDSNDHVFDTTVLLDHFAWSEQSAQVLTMPAP